MDNYATNAGGPLTHWVRTEPIRDRRRLHAFQEEFTQRVGGVHVEPVDGVPLAMAGGVTGLEDLMLGLGNTSPSLCIHPTTGGGEDHVMLTRWNQGQSTFTARGRQWDLADGDAVLNIPGQIATVAAHTSSQICMATLSRKRLAAMHIDVDAALLRPQRGNAAAAMLSGYVRLLHEQQGALATPALQRAAALHVYDLVALVAGAPGDVAQLAHGRGVRAARLLAVKQDIENHFTNPALSAAMVAARQGITPRYLHMLLEQEGLSFSALVLERRLALAWRMLADPRLMVRPIGAIALDVGFNDLSYFNRSFRRRYGMTPSQTRSECAQARR